MKTKLFLLSTAIVTLAGCATDEDRQVRYHGDRYYVVEESPADRDVIVERDGHRAYVREQDNRDYRGTPEFQNNMEPRVRGKHAESLGWNTENYYLQRGYH